MWHDLLWRAPLLFLAPDNGHRCSLGNSVDISRHQTRRTNLKLEQKLFVLQRQGRVILIT